MRTDLSSSTTRIRVMGTPGELVLGFAKLGTAPTNHTLYLFENGRHPRPVRKISFFYIQLLAEVPIDPARGAYRSTLIEKPIARQSILVIFPIEKTCLPLVLHRSEAG